MRYVSLAALMAVAAACGDGGVAVVGTLAIDPPALALPAGGDGAVTVRLSDQGTPLALPGPVTWTVRDPRVAEVIADDDGGAVIHGLAQGSTVLTASLGDVTARSALTVTPPRLVALTVTPAAQTVVSGVCAHFDAVGRFGDGTTVALDPGEVGWGISAQGFSEDGRGAFCPFGVRGDFTVFAGYRDQLARATLIVTPAALTDLTLFAPPLGVVGGDRFASAIATFADGAGADVTADAAWSSSDPAVLTVDAGRIHGVAVGTATVVATYGGLVRDATVEIAPPTLVDLVLDPAKPSLPVGGHQAMTARALYDNGATADASGQVTWSTLDTSVFTVDAAGVVTGVGPGTAFVRAALPPLVRVALITVTP
ncbi:MAG: Ig-like domain-containing protein [Myxococcales bacterium]|nr:Ig-like domain-containing protein [Myxococcales bacterium]